MQLKQLAGGVVAAAFAAYFLAAFFAFEVGNLWLWQAVAWPFYIEEVRSSGQIWMNSIGPLALILLGMLALGLIARGFEWFNENRSATLSTPSPQSQSSSDESP